MNALSSPTRRTERGARRPEEWLALAPREHGATIRLFCFPYAGAGASVFRGWPAALPEWIEVLPIRLPGRETRFTEDPLEDMGELVDLLAESLRRWTDLPYALFGHSMGARVAWSLADRLRAEADGGPIRLITSASPGPELRIPVSRADDSDESLAAWLRHVGGTPPELLDDPDVREILLPIVRADTALVRSRPGRTGPPLDCPIRAFAGFGDDYATPERVRAWSRETVSRFAQSDLPGGHLFLHEQARAIQRTIANDLAADLAERAERGQGRIGPQSPPGSPRRRGGHVGGAV